MGSIEMKILIKGAGDLATGIASRLYGAGHQIMMTDIAVPLTVRRLVAFSRAVYEGEAVVEDMTARLAKNQEEAEEIMEQGDIPVIVDPSHGTGIWDLVPPMARAGVASGADGMIVEIHPDPANAWSDGPQSLNEKTYSRMMKEVTIMKEAMEKIQTLD